jgi:hypothetical protein
MGQERLVCKSRSPQPAGMTGQEDMENWNYAHAASRGAIARRYPSITNGASSSTPGC